MDPTLAPAATPAVAVSRLHLPVYRMRLHRQPYHARQGGRCEQRWTSEWTIDDTDPLGGERSVYTWLHAIRGNVERDALKLTVLYWSIRAIGGTHPDRPFDLDEVPASRQLDCRHYVGMFELLADATWCDACRSAPMASDRGLCLWCEAAPIGRIWGWRD